MGAGRVRRGTGTLPVAVVALLIAALAAAAGWGAAASLRVVHASGERAGGVDVGLASVPYWWLAERVLSTTVPPLVPPLLNGSAGAPTRLPGANVTYLLGSAASGAAAIGIDYRENVTAPLTTEVELRFTLSLTGGASVRVTGYVETGSSSPTFPVIVRFLFATGAITLSGATIQSVAVASLLCSSVGTCP